MRFSFAKPMFSALAIAMIGCSQTPAPEAAPAVSQMEKPAPKIAVEELALAVDPFCNMSLKEHPIADTCIHEGKTYGFCSSYCKDEFLKDPATCLAKAAQTKP